ncbi:MAG: aldo/keto reductase [Candidatus Zixiibacteriota bacterium]|nr:MAG: aldo/keto reductase [candidate division Zixibacteria bacterium]
MGKGDSGLTRRRFLSASAVGLASAGLMKLAPTGALAQPADKKADKPAPEIIYRKFGGHDLALPIVSMGILGGVDPRLVQTSYEIGIRLIDTSPYPLGGREIMVGSVINRLKVREKVIIATGTGFLSGRDDVTPTEARKVLMSGCEASLRRLGTDYIDILYYHDVSNAGGVHPETIVEGMRLLKQQGKIRYIGISTHARMAEVINEVTRVGFYDVIETAFNFTMADDAGLLTAVQNAAEKGIAVVAMKSQAGGSRWPNPQTRREYTAATIAGAALKWVMRNENIATCVSGYTNYEHMEQNFSVAYDLEYTAEEKKFLSDNNVRLSMGFCRQCHRCRAACPEGVDIPDLMRAHMYAAQYGDLYQARATLDAIGDKAGLGVCRSCSTCRAKCAHTVDIARRLDELKTLYA